MTPLPFDPIARAADLWDERVGSATSMAAVTSFPPRTFVSYV